MSKCFGYAHTQFYNALESRELSDGAGVYLKPIRLTEYVNLLDIFNGDPQTLEKTSPELEVDVLKRISGRQWPVVEPYPIELFIYVALFHSMCYNRRT